MFTCTKSEMRELIRGSSKWAALMTELGDEPQITECPDGLIIDGWLGIDKWAKVTALPDNLSKVSGALTISFNGDFMHLPDNLTVGGDLDLRRCAGITMLPRDAKIGGGVFWGDDWWG